MMSLRMTVALTNNVGADDVDVDDDDVDVALHVHTRGTLPPCFEVCRRVHSVITLECICELCYVSPQIFAQECFDKNTSVLLS